MAFVSILGILVFRLVAGFIILALSNSLALVFISRIIDGLTAGNVSVAQAYISDVTEPKDRTKAFGILGSAFSLGFIIGPALSGFLAHYGPHYPIVLAACLSFISIMATILILPKTEIQQNDGPRNKFAMKNILNYLKMKEVAPLLFQFFAFIFSFSFFMTGFAMFCGEKFSINGRNFGAQEVGWIFTYIGVLSLIVQTGLLKLLGEKWGEKKIVIVGFLSMSLGFFLVGEISSVQFLLGALVLSTFGSSVLRPSITSQITKVVPRSQQGTILGVTQSLQSMAQVIAPLIGGYLIGEGHLSGWAWVSSFSALIGLSLILFQNKLNKA